jgi:putative oxidoreductase
VEEFLAEAPRLIVPVLGPLYAALAPVTAPLIRAVAGLSLLAHGAPKFLDLAGNAQFFENAGYWPGMFWAVAVGLTETVGGLFLAIGFLTRLACLPILIFLVNAISYHWQFGFYWNNRGIEYPLFWSIVVFHFLVHGGGAWSVDARLGREV